MRLFSIILSVFLTSTTFAFTGGFLCSNQDETSMIAGPGETKSIRHKTEVLIYNSSGAYMSVNTIDLDTGVKAQYDKFEIGYLPCTSQILAPSNNQNFPIVNIACKSETSLTGIGYNVYIAKDVNPTDVYIRLDSELFPKPILNLFSCKVVDYDNEIKRFKN